MRDGVAWLFCPADRPDRFTKAVERADVVIIDLEDAVAPGDRAAAREALRERPLDPERCVVRINPAVTSDHDLDLATVARTDYARVMLAKTESAEEAAALAPLRVVALCETPRGVVNATAIAAVDNVDAVMWGAEDLVAALGGGTTSRHADGTYRDVARHARASVLLGASASDKSAIDAVYLDIADLDGLHAEASDAVASGFTAKACVHPRQVAVVRDAYRPRPDQLAWAQEVLEISSNGVGVFSHKGQMIDEPILRQARRIMARNG